MNYSVILQIFLAKSCIFKRKSNKNTENMYISLVGYKQKRQIRGEFVAFVILVLQNIDCIKRNK